MTITGILIVAMPLMAAIIALKSAALVIVTVGGLMVVLIGLGLFSSALNGIYTTAVYRYATEGQVGEFFDADLAQNAFRQK